MNIVLLTHAPFVVSQSMPRFARLLRDAYVARGHNVEVWTASPHIVKLVPKGRLTKWAGYIDQYLIFPVVLRSRLKKQAADTLYAFCDHALGPWMPPVSRLPHVVHCHDFLALRSALGDIPENPTSLTGKLYQRYIRRGFRHAQHFISISERTKQDLEGVGGALPVTSVVVYNGLNFPYRRMESSEAISTLESAGLPANQEGMLLHVGGGQWYKNTRGIIEIYGAYARRTSHPLPLWIIGPAPRPEVKAAIANLPDQACVLFFQGLDNNALQACYSHAKAFLFPSLNEGFGWPIIEAQACGCPVITTDEAPMNEIGGSEAHYLSRLQLGDDIRVWAEQGAALLERILSASEATRETKATSSIAWAHQFDKDAAIDAYLRIYSQVARAREYGAASAIDSGERA